MYNQKNSQIFIGKLPLSVSEEDLDYEFRRFGPIKEILIKRGYAFLEYNDYHDASEAIADMNGRRFLGITTITVQHAVGKRRDTEAKEDDRSYEHLKSKYQYLPSEDKYHKHRYCRRSKSHSRKREDHRSRHRNRSIRRSRSRHHSELKKRRCYHTSHIGLKAPDVSLSRNKKENQQSTEPTPSCEIKKPIDVASI